MRHNIALLNDSFPPQIDGVANTVVNYAKIIERDLGHSMVITPNFPEANDEGFPFPVVRYPSFDARNFIGYMAGVPFSPTVLKTMKQEQVELLHCHCPAAAMLIARETRFKLKAPVVFTYHTKYDVDLLKALKLKLLSSNVVKMMVSNISSCDEVWTVSHGAGENLKSLGFEGEYIVMPNGVDMPLGRLDDEFVEETVKDYDLPHDVPVFLFVGRMMWYKGIRLILDAVAGLKARGFDFRMVFIGDGADATAIRAYTDSLQLNDKVIFTGALRDRQVLKAWYCRADLFLFPSTYDTNGLVVREAAACSLASILVRGSCAAEDVTEDRNGFFMDETAESLEAKLAELCEHPEAMKAAGEKAAEELYISWDTAVRHAYDRYEVVLENFRAGKYPRRRHITDEILRANGELMTVLSKMPLIDTVFGWFTGD
ncbi:MAG: glycosyltransferase [Lachnospiraceae bacterium]|nr:glycosyltransferase [Lachnospiraceae bacterium]